MVNGNLNTSLTVCWRITQFISFSITYSFPVYTTLFHHGIVENQQHAVTKWILKSNGFWEERPDVFISQSNDCCFGCFVVDFLFYFLFNATKFLAELMLFTRKRAVIFKPYKKLLKYVFFCILFFIKVMWVVTILKKEKTPPRMWTWTSFDFHLTVPP